MGRPLGSKNKTHKQFCPKNHDTFIVGRNKKGMCNQCDRDRKHTDTVRQKARERHNKNKEKINAKRRLAWPEYSKVHPLTEEQKARKKVTDKEWIKNHRDSINARNIKAATNRSLRIVTWTDWDKILEIYKNCPEDKEVDHYIPLQGELISGLHVDWNLQHLTPHENRSKLNQINLLEASNWYGKILEEVGLK